MKDPARFSEPSKRYLRAARRYPELLLFPNDDTRKKALKLALQKALRSPMAWLCVIGCSIGIQLYFRLVVLKIALFALHLPGALISAISSGIAVWLSVTLLFSVGRNKVRQSLRLQLREMHVPVCQHCGYDLRGQVEARCPECGREYDAGLLKQEGK